MPKFMHAKDALSCSFTPYSAVYDKAPVYSCVVQELTIGDAKQLFLVLRHSYRVNSVREVFEKISQKGI